MQKSDSKIASRADARIEIHWLMPIYEILNRSHLAWNARIETKVMVGNFSSYSVWSARIEMFLAAFIIVASRVGCED